MNFTWCGQSCGSTSRAFIHEKIYNAVLDKVKAKVSHYKPGNPTDPATTMGSIITKVQYERVLGFIESAKQEGGRLLYGGGRPNDPALANGFYIEPTIFADVTRRHAHRARGNFRPGAVDLQMDATKPRCLNRSTRWNTASPPRSGPTIFRPRTAPRRRCRPASSGSTRCRKHFLGAPFGGYKQSGIGREECFEEMLAYTQEKNIHVRLKPAK